MYYANFGSVHVTLYYTVDCSCVGRFPPPFLTKSCAHTHTLYAHGHEILQGMRR